jgi:hypothetical protein
MGGALRTTRTKLPPAAAPAPSPVPLDVEVLEKERARRRQKLRQFGRQGTILTGGGLGTSDEASQKGTLLGGSA